MLKDKKVTIQEIKNIKLSLLHLAYYIDLDSLEFLYQA